jgi:hypothetical protein
VLARLDEAGLHPSPPADPATLARRLYFDLLGLPPAPAEVDFYLRDPSAANYQRLVEELLASPHFGERMAVYWLDLVRYADSCGYHSDIEQNISPYRDYVIRAFNENLPFDQFTIEQLAGDLLPDPTLRQQVATGYNRLNKTTEEGGAQDGEYLAKSAADRVRTTAGVWLAATLGCAECHDHKYDPFTTRDFYSFAAFFADVRERGVYKAGNREPEIRAPSYEQMEAYEALQSEIAQWQRQQAAEPLNSALMDKLAGLEQTKAELEKQFIPTMVTVSVEPRTMRVLPRGNWLDGSGPVVEPSLPAFLTHESPPGRRLTRLDLARWLVAVDNPLVPRVFVNRLWKLFFGAGLAKDLDDFGARGEPPIHPQLLDWLAVEFVDSGWDVKHMVRLLVTSNAYRQTSIPTPELARHDPRNRLVARQSRWRIEAEFIRDAALATSGLLVRKLGGPSVKPYQPDGYWDFLNFPKRTWKADTGESQYRRGLYTHWQRTFLHPSLVAFDAPSREECTAERPFSNTPKAALALLNDPTFVEAARVFAARILQESGDGDEARLSWAWQHALLRPPDCFEAAQLAELLRQSRQTYQQHPERAKALLGVGQIKPPDDLPSSELAAWTAVARAIFNLSEFTTRN